MISPRRVVLGSRPSASSLVTMSRSVTMPRSSPCSTSITAPTRRSRMTRAASQAVASRCRQHSACCPSMTSGMIFICRMAGLPSGWADIKLQVRLVAEGPDQGCPGSALGLGGQALDALHDDLPGLVRVGPAQHLDPLVGLEVLVVLEEVGDAPQVDIRNVAVA